MLATPNTQRASMPSQNSRGTRRDWRSMSTVTAAQAHCVKKRTATIWYTGNLSAIRLTMSVTTENVAAEPAWFHAGATRGGGQA